MTHGIARIATASEMAEPEPTHRHERGVTSRGFIDSLATGLAETSGRVGRSGDDSLHAGSVAAGRQDGVVDASAQFGGEWIS